MRMENYIYTQGLISKSLDGEKWEEDENGNPIIIIEASNENMDYQGEIVKRSALMNSKDYFLKNGVISFDHKHLPSPANYAYDPKWNAEKYILGKPLEVWEVKNKEGEKVVKVKAVLSRSNDIAREIIKKLADNIGTVKASVGGRRVTKATQMDAKTFKDAPTIISVEWDEVALTFKPVNQTLGATTLCPKDFDDYKDFVKALTAGGSADPSSMGTGGNTLQSQGVERTAIKTLFEKLRNKEIKPENAISHLVKSGVSKQKAPKVLKMMINKNYLGDVIMAEENVDDVINTASDELAKALGELGGGDNSDTLQKAIAKMKDGESMVKKGGHSYIKKADGTYDKVDKDSPDYNGDDDDDDDDMGKGLDDFIDVSDDIADLKKSISDLKSMVKSLAGTVEGQNTVLKSMGSLAIEDSAMIKSMSGAPLPRVTNKDNITVVPRFEKSQLDGIKAMDGMTMMKSLQDAGVNAQVISRANFAFRKEGMNGVAKMVPEVLPTLMEVK